VSPPPLLLSSPTNINKSLKELGERWLIMRWLMVDHISSHNLPSHMSSHLGLVPAVRIIVIIDQDKMVDGETDNDHEMVDRETEIGSYLKQEIINQSSPFSPSSSISVSSSTISSSHSFPSSVPISPSHHLPPSHDQPSSSHNLPSSKSENDDKNKKKKKKKKPSWMKL